MVRILVVDDHTEIRSLIRVLIEAEKTWQVCGEAADGQQGVEQAKLLAPDIIILDLHMPILNGFEAAKQIVLHSPEMTILIISIDDSSHHSRAAEASGARGFLSKSHVVWKLVPAVTALLLKRTYFSHSN